MSKVKNGIQFGQLKAKEGKWFLHLTEFTNGQRVEHTWEIDAATASGIEKVFAQNPFKRKGKPTVWLKELQSTEGSEEYEIRFDIKSGKSRQHFTKPCSKQFYENLVAIMRKWWDVT